MKRTKMTIELPALTAKMLTEDAQANHVTKTAWLCRAIAVMRKCRRGNVSINGKEVVLL